MSISALLILLVGWSCYVNTLSLSRPIKMNHQICNYYDLMEFLTPVCSRHYKRYRREAQEKTLVSSPFVDDSKQARNFLKSNHARKTRRAVSRDVSYFEECCTNKICSFQELSEYCYVIPFSRLSY